MNKHALAVMALLCLPPAAFAIGHGHGHVQIRGSIVDTACAIATGDLDQVIDMGTLPVAELINDGRGPPVPFTVHLINCTLDGADTHAAHHWKDVRITFQGMPDGKKLFAVHGASSGEGVAIVDAAGMQAVPGEPMSATPILPGEMALHYQLQMEEDSHAIHPGRFTTALRFFMEYE